MSQSTVVDVQLPYEASSQSRAAFGSAEERRVDFEMEEPEKPPVDVSVVIPAYNEVDSVALLAEQVDAALAQLGKRYEILFVDDGSTDGTFDALLQVSETIPAVRAIQFRRNFGKSAALTAGFREAQGDIVVTMDADLQDDPCEIPEFLAALGDGDYDLVSGWKFPRQDPRSKTLPSRVFNSVTAKMSGLDLHDFNCGFKAYRRQVVEEISIYGELYRYIPVLAHWRGFKVKEIKVRHNPRRSGQSKFGVSRFPRGFFDLLTVLFLTRYLRRPLHLFGWIGIMSSVAGGLILAYLSALWFMGIRPIGDRPLLTLGVLLITLGIQFFTLGLLAEMLASMLTKRETNYSIRRKLN
jgi:glycosyltransferase involved in cell wall biosynthesis